MRGTWRRRQRQQRRMHGRRRRRQSSWRRRSGRRRRSSVRRPAPAPRTHCTNAGARSVLAQCTPLKPPRLVCCRSRRAAQLRLRCTSELQRWHAPGRRPGHAHCIAADAIRAQCATHTAGHCVGCRAATEARQRAEQATEGSCTAPRTRRSSPSAFGAQCTPLTQLTARDAGICRRRRQAVPMAPTPRLHS